MGLCLTQLCTKYRLVSTYVESLPLVVKDNHKVKASEHYEEAAMNGVSFLPYKDTEPAKYSVGMVNSFVSSPWDV